MNTAQQTALETLVGRALTAEEISAIDPLLADRNDSAIATLLSQGRTKLVQHMIGERGAPTAGAPTRSAGSSSSTGCSTTDIVETHT